MIVPGFKVGDRVRVVNDISPVSGSHPAIDDEYVIGPDDVFDDEDNSWRLQGVWVYEPGLELVEPALTDDEVAAAVASLKEE